MTIWTARLFPVVPLLQQGGGSVVVGEVDAVTADRAALWLQWLAPLARCEA